MAFAESVRTLANQIEERKKHVLTEEATKQALILPFLALLGYDVYNPAELVPEFRAGWAKGAEKIDYALQISGKPVVFVEAKGPNEVLVNYDPQLAKYFNSTPEVKFAIITNGVQHRFFTDLQERNILDKKPFFEFDFSSFAETDIAVLERFRKEVFSLDSLVGYAEDLVFLSSLKIQFKALLREPSDDFVRFAVSVANLADGRVTQKVVDRFRPLVKESLSAAILDIVGQSFLARSVETGAETEDPIAAPVEESSDAKEQVQTTEEELQVYEWVAHSVSSYVPEPEKLQYQDTTGYLAVQYAKSTGWFARFRLQGKKGKHVYLRLPLERVRELAPAYTVEEVNSSFGSCRVLFQSLDDLRGLQEVLIQAVKEVI